MIQIYKLIGDNNFFHDPIEQVFINRNVPVEDIEWFKNPTPFEYDSSLLQYMEEGVNLLLSHVEQDSHIHVQIDLDLDGFTSSAILINYLKRVYPNINLTWSNHTDKMKHGIEVELIPPETKLLVVPDAGSGEYEILQQLDEKGIDVLIIDHHPVEKYSEHAITINNNLDDYPNKQLSAAPVVLKFTQYMDKKLGLNYSKDMYDLASVGLIGDAMLIDNKETKWITHKGLSNIKNELLQELVKENIDKGVELTPKQISFKIAPKINSLIRVGTAQEKDEFMMALLGHQEITINNRLRKADKTETWARRMTRTCNNTYARQRKLREQILEEIESKIERDKLHENHFIVVEVEGSYESNMSGLLAMSVVSKYRKPCLILRKQEDGLLVGSLRGYDSFMLNTKSFLESLDTFEDLAGHENACGVKLKPEMVFTLNNKIGEALSHVESDKTYYVDFEMNEKSMNESFINEMESYSHIFGRGLSEPTYAITNVSVRSSDIQLIGKAQNVLKFNKGNVEYIQFSADPELVRLKEDEMDLTLNIIGQTSINSWLGRKTSQVVIEAIEITEIKEDLLGGFLF